MRQKNSSQDGLESTVLFVNRQTVYSAKGLLKIVIQYFLKNKIKL